jgi:hypothetical protein
VTTEPPRKAVVVLNLTVVLRRVENDDNGPAQSVDAVRKAGLVQLDGTLLDVQEFAGRAAADYELTVAGAAVANTLEQMQALHALGLDADGRPKPGETAL